MTSSNDPAAGASPSAVLNAIERGIAKYRVDAEREVESILDAALRVAERVAPAAPKVADIIAEAGSSNQAFYRYFGGKDDLLQAVRERGTRRLYDYLDHQMSKASGAPGAVEAWVRGVLAQATNRRVARQSAAINLQLATQSAATADADTESLRTLLAGALSAGGSVDARRDADALFEAVFGTLRRHLALDTSPTDADVDHLVALVLRAPTTTPIDRGRRARR